MKFVHAFEAHQGAGVAFEITENSSLGWADFHTRRQHVFCNPVVTEGAFIRRGRFRIEISCAIRTRLNAVPAADTTLGIDKDDAVFGFKCRTDRTDLDTGGIFTLVAKLGDKEATEDIFLGNLFGGKFSELRIDAPDINLSVFPDNVLLYPCSEKERDARNIVFFFAGFHALSASDAFVDLNAHPIIMPGGIVRRKSGNSRFFEHSSQHADLSEHGQTSFKKISSFHFSLPPACVGNGIANINIFRRALPCQPWAFPWLSIPYYGIFRKTRVLLVPSAMRIGEKFYAVPERCDMSYIQVEHDVKWILF
jgi:hypothetical protein